jgi:ribonuclease VapC
VIAVDTSALMAILLDEPESDSLIAALEADPEIVVSAAIVAEALIVAARRNVADEMTRLVEDLGLTVVSVTASTARRVADAYAAWGKGVHPAGLNFGDCFSYVLARDHDCPLLYVGDDFAATDLPVRPVGT